MERHSAPRGQPWMRNERWSSGVIRDQSAENLSIVWLFTLAWNIITALVLIPHLKQGIPIHDKVRLLALVFPAIGLGLLTWAARRTRRRTKFGESVFNLRTLPATPGGELAGTIHVPRRIGAGSRVQLDLVCINRIVAGFGRNRRVIDHVVWREAQTVDGLPPCDSGTDIPVLFHIPPDGKPTSDLDLGDGVRWRLEARGKTGGVSYYSRFDVPVFVVVAPKPAARRRREPAIPPDSIDAPKPRGNFSEEGITCERIGGRLHVHFAAARDKTFVVQSTVIGLALTAIAIGLANWHQAPMDRLVQFYVVFVVLGVGGIFDCIALFNWLATDEIRVRYGSLTVEHRAPFLLRQRTFKTADVADIFPKMDGDSPAASGGGKKRIFHSLMLKTPDGDLVRLANDIIQKDYAAWLADEIKGAFGVAARK